MNVSIKEVTLKHDHFGQPYWYVGIEWETEIKGRAYKDSFYVSYGPSMLFYSMSVNDVDEESGWIFFMSTYIPWISPEERQTIKEEIIEKSLKLLNEHLSEKIKQHEKTIVSPRIESYQFVDTKSPDTVQALFQLEDDTSIFKVDIKFDYHKGIWSYDHFFAWNSSLKEWKIIMEPSLSWGDAIFDVLSYYASRECPKFKIRAALKKMKKQFRYIHYKPKEF